MDSIERLKHRVINLLGELEVGEDNRVAWTHVANAMTEISLEFKQFESENMRLESLEKTRERAEAGMGHVHEALDILNSGMLYEKHPFDAGVYDGDTPKDIRYKDQMDVIDDKIQIERLKNEVSKLMIENRNLTKWKETIINLCMEMGASSIVAGGDPKYGFVYRFIKHLYTKATTAEGNLKKIREITNADYR